MNKFLLYAKGFFHLIYPNTCQLCGRQLVTGEEHLCVSCLLELPKTWYHKESGNPVEQLFWGRARIDRASTFFFYQKGNPSQQLLHHLKYHNKKEIGYALGKTYAYDLIGTDWVRETDYFLPIPLHPKKQRMRGYNQAEWIAKGLSKTLKIPVNTDIIYRQQHSSTQTRKNRYDRWENVSSVFGIKNPELLINKTVIIVDDVITTGSTIDACVQQLIEIPGIRINVMALGLAIN